MFKETFESLSSSLSERLVNPFTGSFLLSWPIWNYKLILILLADIKVQVKISMISTLAYPDLYHTIFLGLLAPALTALAYVYIYPHPSRWIMKYSLEQKRKLKELRQKVDDETLLTKEESDRLKRLYNTGARQLENDIDEKNDIIKQLRAEAAAVTESSAETDKELRGAKSDVEVLRANLTEVSNRLSSAQFELEKMQKSNTQLHIENSSSQGQVMAMADQVNNLKAQLGESQQKVNATSSELSGLRVKYEALSDEMSTVRGDYLETINYSASLGDLLQESSAFARLVNNDNEASEASKATAKTILSKSKKLLNSLGRTSF